MTDDLDADMDDFARYLALPETGMAAMEALHAQYMAPAEYVGTMKVLNLRLNQEDRDASR